MKHETITFRSNFVLSSSPYYSGRARENMFVSSLPPPPQPHPQLREPALLAHVSAHPFDRIAPTSWTTFHQAGLWRGAHGEVKRKRLRDRPSCASVASVGNVGGLSPGGSRTHSTWILRIAKNFRRAAVSSHCSVVIAERPSRASFVIHIRERSYPFGLYMR